MHPIAPLYAPLALLTGLAARPSWRTSFHELRPAILAGALVASPYVYALAVLRSRYHVGEAPRLRTTAGRPVVLESLHALTPGGTAGVIVFSGLAVGGFVTIARSRLPVAVALAAWVVVPVVFFTVVPAQTRFFGRYLLPALPEFLLLVLAACFAAVRLAGAPLVLAAAVAFALVAVEGRDDFDRMRELHRLRLPALAAAVHHSDVLFSSTGSPRSDRPPELLDDYVALRTSPAFRVEELPAIDPRYESGLIAKGRRQVVAFLRADPAPARGVWIFRGRPRRIDAALRRLTPAFSADRISREVALVRSHRLVPAAELVRQSLIVRIAWGLGTPADRWPRVIASVDRTALGG